MSESQVNEALVSAIRRYADWSEEAPYDRGPDWLYVHKHADGREEPLPFNIALRRAADLFEVREIALLKLQHLEKVFGKEQLERFLRSQAR